MAGFRRETRLAVCRLTRIAALAWLLAAVALPAAAAPAAPVEAAAEEIVGIATATGVVMRTRVFRPPGPGPFPLAVVSHGSPVDAARRPEMPIPAMPAISNWLLQRGYIVALPLRRGYGETGGPWLENYGRCNDPDFYRAGLTTAEDIEAAVRFFRARADVARNRVLLMGVSAGGWGSIAAASQNPAGVFAVVNFAGGRAGHRPRVGNCTPQRLIDAAGRYGATAHVPSIWLYSANDTFFGPELSRRVFDAYVRAGAKAEYVALPAFGSDGHRLFGADAGRALWQPPVGKFLATFRD